MLDIGFWEITLLLIISIIVLGPERVKTLASHLAKWWVKLSQIKQNLANELEPIHQAQSHLNDEVRSLEAKIQTESNPPKP